MSAAKPRLFPLLFYYDERRKLPPPLSNRHCGVPWEIVAPHAAQAVANHDQTLERLAERGGLGPDELLAVLEDRRWRQISNDDALALLRERGIVPQVMR